MIPPFAPVARFRGRFRVNHRLGAAVSALLGLGLVIVGTLSSNSSVWTTVVFVGAFLVMAPVLSVVLGRRQLRVNAALLRQISQLLDEEVAKLRTELSSLAEQGRAHRAAQSRHEYLQESTLDRIESISTAIRADVEGLTWERFGTPATRIPFAKRTGRPRVLFITSNGAGVGHFARCVAIAKSGADLFESVILSLSRAAHEVPVPGIPLLYYASQRDGGKTWSAWHRDFSRFLYGVIQNERPDVIVFDGTWIFRAVTETARRHQIPLVWLARGTWKSTADRAQLNDAAIYCDAVLRPADISGETEAVAGVDVCEVAPIVANPPSLQSSRVDAMAHLGLDPRKKHVLVQFGAGVVNEISAAREAAVRAIGELGDDWNAVIAQSPLDMEHLEESAQVSLLRCFPIAMHLKAFEFCVIAAGYNSVHEAISAHVPAVIMPNGQTLTDDQLRRSEAVVRKGLGVEARSISELETAIRALGDSVAREDMRRRANAIEPMLGAAQCAAYLANYTSSVAAPPGSAT